MTADRRFEELEADARFATERYRLYRARVSGPHATSTGRLRDLQRESERAQRTLARAREQAVSETVPQAEAIETET